MQLQVRAERWPIAGAFRISRGAKTEAGVVVVELTDGPHRGWAESVPYARYGETVEGVIAAVEALRGEIEAGIERTALADRLPPGAARNAVDCALWDLEAKQAGRRAWMLAGRERLDPVKTCFSLSLDTPQAMAEAAGRHARWPMLKLKLGGPDDLDRVRAVRAAAPRARLILDANEALKFEDFQKLAPEYAKLDVKLIEQPLAQAEDGALEGWPSPVLLCADESLHTRAELAACAGRYGAVNIKLDKTGGLTEALALVQDARALELEIMAGCMVGTSLAMAPALLIAQGAAFVDLDGPLLLAKDREPGLTYLGALIQPPAPDLWG